MARPGDLEVGLSVDASRFAGGLRRANRSIDGFRGSVSRLSIAITGINQALSIAGRVGRFAQQFAGAAESAGQWGARLVETSRSVNITANELELLRRVFEADGVAAEKLDKALSDLNRQIGLAQIGTGEAVIAFNELFGSVEELSGLDSGEAFRRVVQTLAAIEDPARRAALGTRLFQESYRELDAAVLSVGGNLDEAVARFREMGQVTNVQAQNLKDLAQTFTDVRNELLLTFRGAVADNAAAFGDIVRLIGDYAVFAADKLSLLEGAIERFLPGTFEDIQIIRGERYIAILEEAGHDTGELRREVDRAANSWFNLGTHLSDVLDGYELTVEQVQAVQRALDRARTPRDAAVPRPSPDALNAWGEVTQYMTAAGQAFNAFRETTARLEASTESIGLLTGEHAEEIRRQARATVDQAVAMRQLNDQLRREEDVRYNELGLLSPRQQEARNRALEEARRQTELNRQAALRYAQAWQNVGQFAVSSLDRILNGARTTEERLRALADILFRVLAAGLSGLAAGGSFFGGVGNLFGFDFQSSAAVAGAATRPDVQGYAGPSTVVVQGVQDPHVVASQVASALQPLWRRDIATARGR